MLIDDDRDGRLQREVVTGEEWWPQERDKQASKEAMKEGQQEGHMRVNPWGRESHPWQQAACGSMVTKVKKGE